MECKWLGASGGNGLTRTATAHTLRVSLRAVSNWMMRAREGGLTSLMSGKRGRRPGSGRLDHRQPLSIRKLIA
ncbi:helix-turn-helix domain-containing protein [Caballeronia novacaledonica]|uniref:helix-turn-helix domain-containing protein n=1 Tax=Caballeronia novacaledonica TaxID=1544861 RepID=UPI001EE34C8A|nr:helix-turn-helix domain-containing protein [Caballeronia novacaledonica]